MLVSLGYGRNGTGVISNCITCSWMCKKGRQNEHYSVIAITLCYISALSHNSSTQWRKVIAFDSYRSGLMGNVIAFYSYTVALRA